jgi:hypothetical protein
MRHRKRRLIVGSPSTALSLVVGGSKSHAPDNQMFSCFSFTSFKSGGVFLAIDGKRMIIIMSFLNCIQEKKHGKAGRVGVGGRQWSQFLIGFGTAQG